MEKIINQIEENIRELINQFEELKKKNQEKNTNEVLDRLSKVESELVQLRKAIV
jgi:ElaB/YqjD/DUF883 family membrane-anchored ribosome-binding protein